MKKRKVHRTAKPIICLFTVCCILILSVMSGSALDSGCVRFTVRQVFDTTLPDADNTFEYSLTPLDYDAPMPSASENGEYRFSVSGSDTFTTDEISFTDIGEYHYQLRELIGDRREGYTYDEKVYDIVVVVRNTTEGLESIVYFLNKDGYKEPELLFINSYSDSQNVVKDHLTGTKVIEGDPAEEENFVFYLKPASNACPMPDGSDISGKTMFVKGAGSFDTGEIEFSADGIYRYTLFEEDTKIKDYVFDKTVYNITYTVVTEGGRRIIRSCVVSADGKDVNQIVFKNVYNAPTSPTGEIQPTEAEQQDKTEATLPTSPDATERKTSGLISSIAGMGKSDSTGSGPKTGDPIDLVIIVTVMSIALIVLVILLIFKKKDEDDKDDENKKIGKRKSHSDRLNDHV